MIWLSAIILFAELIFGQAAALAAAIDSSAVEIPTVVSEATNGKFALAWKLPNAKPAAVYVELEAVGPGAKQQLAAYAQAQSPWERLLTVRVAQAEWQAELDAPTLAGAYEWKDGKLRFQPRFPIAAGIRCSATFRPSRLTNLNAGGAAELKSDFLAPRIQRQPATELVQAFPSGPEVPENLLKLYLHFSEPMSGGAIYRHIQLFDSHNRTVELPFLEIDEELWDPTMTRLTLFIDPGRIKRGVKPLEDVGPALQAGQSYTLAVDAAWPDASGTPLKQAFRKTWRVATPDRSPPDPERWQLTMPRAESTQPLIVRFDEPMDSALARRLIEVQTAASTAVRGVITLSEQEKVWTFRPEQPWKVGTHALVVAHTIEDLAGNNIGKPFEVDVFETTPHAKPEQTSVTSRPFVIQ